MKKSHHSYKFCIFYLKNCFPTPTYFFRIFTLSLDPNPPSSPHSIKGGGRGELETFTYSHCVSVGIFWCFRMFLLLFAIFDMVFYKDFPLFYDQIKPKPCNRFSPTIKNPRRLFKPTNLKGLLSFWGVYLFGWFTQIGYKRTQFKISRVWRGSIFFWTFDKPVYNFFFIPMLPLTLSFIYGHKYSFSSDKNGYSMKYSFFLKRCVDSKNEQWLLPGFPLDRFFC